MNVGDKVSVTCSSDQLEEIFVDGLLACYNGEVVGVFADQWVSVKFELQFPILEHPLDVEYDIPVKYLEKI